MRQNEFNFNPVQLRNMVCNASVLAALVSNQICLVKRVAGEWGLATAGEVEGVAVKAYGTGATKAIVYTHGLAYYTAAVDTTKYYQSTVTPHTLATTGTFFIGVGLQDAVTSDYTGGILLAIKDTASGGGGSPFATDIVVNGQTVGKGGGNIASNTVHGTSALLANTTGIRNNAIGVSALTSNTTGSNNTAIGVESLQLNTTGSGNNAMGYQSLQNNTIGDTNTAIGSYSLYQNTTGSNNIGIGNQSLSQNTTGSNNTALGASTLINASSTDNTAVGKNAGATVTSGDSNTLIGKEADVSSGAISNSTAIGKGAIATASNQAVIGNSSVTNTILRGVVSFSTSYTVASLPAGMIGDRAYVTDALLPVWNTAVVGGGAEFCPVFKNNTTWVTG